MHFSISLCGCNYTIKNLKILRKLKVSSSHAEKKGLMNFPDKNVKVAMLSTSVTDSSTYTMEMFF